MNILLDVVRLGTSFVLLLTAFIYFLGALHNRRTAQINKETTRVNTDIQATLMKLMDDNLAREKERQQWVATVLEAKAE